MEFKHPSYYKKLAKEKKAKKNYKSVELTGDLFGYKGCKDCNGKGQVEHPSKEEINDCDTCNGTGQQ